MYAPNDWASSIWLRATDSKFNTVYLTKWYIIWCVKWDVLLASKFLQNPLHIDLQQLCKRVCSRSLFFFEMRLLYSMYACMWNTGRYDKIFPSFELYEIIQKEVELYCIWRTFKKYKKRKFSAKEVSSQEVLLGCTTFMIGEKIKIPSEYLTFFCSK